MWIILLIAVVVVLLAHTAPAPFVLDALAGSRAVWHMPRTGPPTVYLTYDDGPNPATTPDLLDALASDHVGATFFVIDRHITDDTAPIVRRMFREGHAVALHSASRREMLKTSTALARQLAAAADRIESLTGSRPSQAFRPHGGWRSASMFAALGRIDYRLIGWGWMLWDVDWFRPRTADRILRRLVPRIGAGDIVVMHDGDESAPRKPQPQTVEATVRLIPLLRARGLEFGTIV